MDTNRGLGADVPQLFLADTVMFPPVEPAVADKFTVVEALDVQVPGTVHT